MKLRTGAVSLLLLVLLGGLAACGSKDEAPGDDPGSVPDKPTPSSLMLDFESGPPLGQVVEAVANSGTGSVDVIVARSGTATVESVEGPDGGQAVRFPAYTGGAVAPAAVIVATATGDALSPLDRDFEFGATVKLDTESSGSAVDDGDNLVQRGNFGDPGQYKIQLDKGVPSCRIVGDAGEVFVKAEEAVEPGAWYVVSCKREGSEVSLTMAPYDDQDGQESWRATGSTGQVSLDAQPLSVGGKVSPEGVPVASADQFNGAMDDVYLRIE